MRDDLARNCSLVGDPEIREKSPMLGLDETLRVCEDQWTPEVTLRKLKQMSKNSTFKGF